MRNSLMDLESVSNDYPTPIQPLMIGFEHAPPNLPEEESQCSYADLMQAGFQDKSQGCLSREELVLLEYLVKNKSEEHVRTPKRPEPAPVAAEELHKPTEQQDLALESLMKKLVHKLKELERQSNATNERVELLRLYKDDFMPKLQWSLQEQIRKSNYLESQLENMLGVMS